MISNLQQGILITLAGMGLVFLVLALLWMLMALLMRSDRRRVSVRVSHPLDAPRTPDAKTNVVDTLVISSNDPADSTLTAVSMLTGGAPGALSPEMLSAVMVAVRMHRRVRRKQAAPAMRTHQPGTLPSRWVGTGRVGQNQSWHPKRK